MKSERLFVETYKELGDRAASQEDYDLLRAAGLLRLLLLDGHPLAQKASAAASLPLAFRYGTFRPDPPGLPTPAFHALEDGLDPETAPPIIPVQEGKLQDFISNPVLRVEGKIYTVRDVIKFAAEAEGGVHHDVKPKDKHAAMRRFSESFSIGGSPSGIRVLGAIARVACRSLRPIKEVLDR